MLPQIVAEKLIEAHKLIHENPDSNGFGGRDLFGHVGAWLYVPSIDTWFWGQSSKLASGKYDHAERVAIKKALGHLKVIKLPKDCVIISTLEPCSKVVPFRNGCSCSKLLERQGIEKVYVGVRDWIQRDHLTGEWAQHSFDMVLTEDPQAIATSQKLFSYLEDYVLASLVQTTLAP